MFEDGLSYPMRGDWLGRTIIGGILSFFSFLLLPWLVVNGYMIRILETTASGVDEPPAFDDWGDLFIKGLVGTVITVIYSVVPFLLFGALGVVLFGLVGIGGEIGGNGGGIIAGIGGIALALFLLLFVPIAFLIYYMVPAALTNYAIKDDFGAAFASSTLKPILLSREYFIAILLPLVVAGVVSIAVTILSITGIGLLVVPLVQFYGQVVIFRMFGASFRSSMGSSQTPPSTTTTAY